MLQNKEGHWVSDQDWNFKPGKDGLIYIESITDNQVLEFRKLDNNVVLEEFEEDKAEQLWKKGEPDDEGYFTLENSKVPKIMTAFSETVLKVKGNITFSVTSLLEHSDVQPTEGCFLRKELIFSQNTCSDLSMNKLEYEGSKIDLQSSFSKSKMT